MTWAVGGTHIGCCRCIADNRATLIYSNGQEKYFDIVKKIHEISPNIMISFAGDIKIGLDIIGLIKSDFIEKQDCRIFAEPEIVAKKLVRYTKYIYEKYFNAKTNYSKVEFLIHISPDDYTARLTKEFVENNTSFFEGMINSAIGVDHISYMEKNIHNSEFYFENVLNSVGKFFTFKASSPNFNISRIEAPLLGQIGSGSNIQDFQEIVKQHETFGFMVENQNGKKPDLVIPTGRHMLRYVAALASEISARGISKTMHIGLISTYGCTIQQFVSPGLSAPNTVDNWDDFKVIMKDKKISVASCIALA